MGKALGWAETFLYGFGKKVSGEKFPEGAHFLPSPNPPPRDMADIPAWDESIGFVLALKVKKLSPDAILPVRGTSRAAGYDLFATKSVIIAPHEKAPVSTDLAVQIPTGYYGRIAPRSGLAVKHFIDVGAGVIDEDYRGPVIVLLFNFSSDAFQVNKGDRIAQLLLEKIATPVVMEVGELDQTERGAGGFGSTGMNVGDMLPSELVSHTATIIYQSCVQNPEIKWYVPTKDEIDEPSPTAPKIPPK
jgi:dUTP pyrophosphatase